MNEQPENLRPIPRYFRQTCEAFASRPAQRYNAELYHGDNNGRLTYDEMRERVEALACGLLSMGLGRQERVGVMSRSSPYWTQADMAIADCAAVSVAIYPTVSAGEVLHILTDSGCRLLFVDSEENLDRIRPVLAEAPDLERVVVMDPGCRIRDDLVLGLWGLMEEGRAWKAENLDAYRERREGVGLDDWYTILYTSGTTGRSKGVVLTHRCVSSRLEGVRGFFSRHGMAIGQEDVTVCYLPLSHIFERGSCQLLALCQGACIAYADRVDTLLDDMRRYNPTWINCVPRLYEKIYLAFREKMAVDPLRRRLFDLALHVGRRALDYRRDHRGCYNMSPDFDLQERLPLALKLQWRLAERLFSRVRALFGSRFRFAFSASAGISADLLLFYYTLGLAVVEGYGSTESASACVLNPLKACKPGFVGIEANDSFARLAEDGELEISGAGLFSQYLNLPGDTGESFTQDGWFRTGDVARLDGFGYYRIVDRKKAIICTASGKNVAPAKLESLFALSPFVEQVFLVGDERNYVSALVVPNYERFMELFEKDGVSWNRDAVRYSQAGGLRLCTEVGEDFVSHPVLTGMIEREVDAVNRQLESYERVRRFTILPMRFTEENGQLTPTQKIRKAAILGEYADLIEAMY